MWSCTCSNSLKIGLFSSAAILFMIGAGFFWVQNDNAIGGEVALVKVIWLAVTIFMWFVMPILMVLDARYDNKARLLLSVFVISMLLRAIIELFMMYVTQNWHPYYGIGHDLLSIVLLLGMVFYLSVKKIKSFVSFVVVLVFMFIAESYFALYMLNNVQGDGPVYFVPSSGHDSVLMMTWVLVSLLALYLFRFVRGWLYEE